jgi:hypothetical protein
MWEPRRLTTLRASAAWYRDSFTFALLLRRSQQKILFQKSVVRPSRNIFNFHRFRRFSNMFMKAQWQSWCWVSPAHSRTFFNRSKHAHYHLAFTKSLHSSGLEPSSFLRVSYQFQSCIIPRISIFLLQNLFNDIWSRVQILMFPVRAAHIELSASQSAWTTAALPPIGSRAA